MRRSGQQDLLIVITSPPQMEDSIDTSPFDADAPDDLVFFCFFRQIEQRTEFLRRMRATADEAVTDAITRADSEGSDVNEAFATEYTRLLREGEAGEALFAAGRWWVGVMRRGYHAYSLKIGFAPYQTSCIISFRELDTPTIRRNLARALQFMEREKSRVLDFFGFGGRN